MTHTKMIYLTMFIGVLGVVYALITVIFQLRAEITLILLNATVIFGLLLFIHYQHKQIRELRVKKKEELAINILRRHLKKCEIPHLIMEKVKQEIHIEGVNASVEREYIGNNPSNEDVSEFVTYAMGDKLLSLNRISLKAYDATNRKRELLIEPIIDWDPSSLKLMKIKFKEPLKQGDKFHILLKYHWPGAISQKDYFALILSPYRPTAGSEFRIAFNKKTKPKTWKLVGEKTGESIKAVEGLEKRGILRYLIPPNKAKENYIFEFQIA